MPWLTEDPQRLQRFRNGDRAVLAEVYTVYSVDLFRHLMSGLTVHVDGKSYRFSGVTSAFDLDDLVQETFVRAFGDNARASYDGIRPFRHYLATIARNLLVDRFRRARRLAAHFTLLESDEAEREDAELDVGPEAQAMTAELRTAYANFLASLDEHSRTLVRLRFEDQQSRREVSEHTGMTEMQVRTREERLRGRLLRALRGFGHLSGIAFLIAMERILRGGG